MEWTQSSDTLKDGSNERAKRNAEDELKKLQMTDIARWVILMISRHSD